MNGLTEKQVLENRNKYGTNEIRVGKRDGFFNLFLESLGDPIIRILLIALGIKTCFLIKDFDWYETVGIVIAIIVAFEKVILIYLDIVLVKKKFMKNC